MVSSAGVYVVVYVSDEGRVNFAFQRFFRWEELNDWLGQYVVVRLIPASASERMIQWFGPELFASRGSALAETTRPSVEDHTLVVLSAGALPPSDRTDGLETTVRSAEPATRAP